MKDIQDRELQVGDTVAYINSYGSWSALSVGVIESFGKQFGKPFFTIKNERFAREPLLLKREGKIMIDDLIA